MEPVGLAVGIAGLFSTCLQTLNLVSEASDFALSSEKILFQIYVERTRLGIWGKSVGILNYGNSADYHKGLDEPNIRESVFVTLGWLKYTFESSERIKEKYGFEYSPQTSASQMSISTTNVNTPVNISSYYQNLQERWKRKQKKASLSQKTIWAVRGQKKSKALVEDLKAFNDNLHALLPVITANDHVSQLRMEEAMKEMRELKKMVELQKTPQKKRLQISGVGSSDNRQSMEVGSILSNRSSFSFQSFRTARDKLSNTLARKRPPISTKVDSSVSPATERAVVTSIDRIPHLRGSGDVEEIVLEEETDGLEEHAAPDSLNVQEMTEKFGLDNQSEGKALDEGNEETLRMLHGMADMYHGQKRFNEAASLYEQVMGGRKKLLGDEHRDTLVAVHELAVTYWRLNRFGEAAPLFEQVMDGRKKLLGEQHKDTLSTMRCLAYTYGVQNRFDEAGSLYELVIDGQKKVLGEEHPSTLLTMNNLAYIYATQNQYNKAELLYKRALESRIRVLGAEHVDTLMTAQKLAKMYNEQKRFRDEESVYKGLLNGR